MTPIKLFTATANKVGTKVSVEVAGEHIIAIAASAAFGGGTLTVTILDNATGIALAGDAAKYVFTGVFEAFKLFLAPGMAVQVTLTGATSPNIDSVFMYPTER